MTRLAAMLPADFVGRLQNDSIGTFMGDIMQLQGKDGNRCWVDKPDHVVLSVDLLPTWSVPIRAIGSAKQR